MRDDGVRNVRVDVKLNLVLIFTVVVLLVLLVQVLVTLVNYHLRPNYVQVCSGGQPSGVDSS
jgi:hypothetical protein